MSNQPKALFLADWLEDQYDPTHNQEDAAAELRRLYELNQELLEALKDAAWCVQNDYCPDNCGHDWDDIIARAELK